MTVISSSLLSAGISAVLWIVISALTGGTALFVILGGIVCGIVVFAIGYSFRRLFLPRRSSV